MLQFCLLLTGLGALLLLVPSEGMGKTVRFLASLLLLSVFVSGVLRNVSVSFAAVEDWVQTETPSAETDCSDWYDTTVAATLEQQISLSLEERGIPQAGVRVEISRENALPAISRVLLTLSDTSLNQQEAAKQIVEEILGGSVSVEVSQ